MPAKKILVVENVRVLVEALEAKLTRDGYEVKAALDGEKALEIMAKEHFDVIILDLIMPHVDGFAVLREMKKRNITSPVLVASNLGEQEQINYAKALGATDYLVKSETPLTEIIERIKKISP